MSMTLEERMKRKFSIFYGLIINKSLDESTRVEILAKVEEIKSLFYCEENKLEILRKQALKYGKESKLIEFTKHHLVFDKFSVGCDTQIELLVTKIQEIDEAIQKRDAPANNTRSKTALSQVAPKPKSTPPPIPPKPKIATSPVVHIKSPTFKDVKEKFGLFIVSIIGYYTMFSAPEADYQLAQETISINGKQITVNTSDVRGDGACGFRAILTSFLQKSGIKLSYAPFGMENFILTLKECMFELLTVLSKNPENREFVNGMIHNRHYDGPKGNVTQWFEMVKPNDYYCTDGDIKLIAILFGMLPERDRITQINVLKLCPVEHNPYQSFNCYGTQNIVPPSARDHINIIHTGGHFRSVSNFVGILPPILGLDSIITLPE